MIVPQLKSRFRQAEPVSRELAALFQGAFQHYRVIRDDFLAELPSHLHASELVSLVNVELKGRLFHPQFCEQVQDELKSLRRTLIRLEDLRAAHANFPPVVNDLEQLTRLGERAEALYQRHWEHYRYPTHLNEEALVTLLLDIHQLCEDWDAYFTRFSAVHALVDSLTGQGLPNGTAALRIAYTQAPPLHFSVGMLQTLMDFLDAAYRFVADLQGVDRAAQPLLLQQVDVADPVELALALPAPLHDAYAATLQYLFLKDMLKREALLKFVLETVEQQFGNGRRLDSAAHLKDLAARLKALPSTGRFTISGRTFPDEQIAVLQDFTATMERHQIDATALLGGDKPKAGRKTKPAVEGPPRAAPEASAPRPTPEPAAVRPSERPSLNPPSAPRIVPAAGPAGEPQPRQHLHILTVRNPD